MILLILIITGMTLEVEKFNTMEECLIRSKAAIGEKRIPSIDPGFYQTNFKVEVTFCVQGNVI